MQNLIGPIVKNAEIFHNNIFIPFSMWFWGQNVFYGAYHIIIGKVKKFGPD